MTFIVGFICAVVAYVLGRSARGDVLAELDYQLGLARRTEERLRRELAAAWSSVTAARAQATAARDQADAARSDLQAALVELRAVASRCEQGLLPAVAGRAIAQVIARHDSGVTR